MSSLKQTTTTDTAGTEGVLPELGTATPVTTIDNSTATAPATSSTEKVKAASTDAPTTTSASTAQQPAASISTNTPSSSSSSKKIRADQYPHHVLFVVHGMGRQLEEFGNYERNVGYLVENTKTVLQSQFHELQTDVHIIPIEWHAKLHSMVDQRMSLASLRTVPKVRLVMNDYFADILYYFNNHYGAEIVGMIVKELNEAYSTFIAKHPDFNGKIAVYALSLGGVAMFDILTCMDDVDPEDPNDVVQSAKDSAISENTASKDGTKTGSTTTATPASASAQSTGVPLKKRIRKQDQPKYRSLVPKLKFRPDYLFTVGSPVGAVMVMRNLDWETFHPPDDIIHHNLFHPFDPLAYRIEPLIDPIFAAIPAVTLTPTGNSQLFPISLPSLASLPSIPGSISSFLQNRVSGLPIPSIPTAVHTTLSQMTQSLKAGRWLVGGGNGGGGQHKTDTASVSNDSGRESPTEDSTSGKGQRSNDGVGLNAHGKRHKSSHLSQRTDAAVSVTEAIAAATAATYLDQRGSAATPNPVPSSGGAGLSMLIDEGISTTTGSPNVVTGLVRRPSLGPRRVSSRVENETPEENAASAAAAAATGSGSFHTNLTTQAEEDEQQHRQPPSITQASTSEYDGIPPPLQMEYYLGMEKGPSTAEREQGMGAKSKVVQEDMVRSIPSPPVRDTYANHSHFIGLDAAAALVSGKSSGGSTEAGLEDIQAAHEETEAAKLEGGKDVKGKKVTIEDATEGAEQEQEEKSGKKRKDDASGKVGEVEIGRGSVRVGGRETKVPYRIDHVLQETRVDQYTNEYLLGMRGHFRYWGNRDIAYHILKNILQQEGSLEVLDLKPDMPRAVSAPKNAKEAAEAKAKATAASYRQGQVSAEQQQHRRSFSFSAFNPFSGVEQSDGGDSAGYSRGSGYYCSSGYGDGGGGGGYGDEEKLYGYRYSDLDMSCAANVGFSSNTLYQNSPFAKSTSTSSGGTGDGAVEGRQQQVMAMVMLMDRHEHTTIYRISKSTTIKTTKVARLMSLP
ncbi:hypothetical protein BGX23_000554 [Mortierella sp. AD031]|nr:hypothetical protein BGX23_000554 [Mortierella sp. AD031]